MSLSASRSPPPNASAAASRPNAITTRSSERAATTGFGAPGVPASKAVSAPSIWTGFARAPPRAWASPTSLPNAAFALAASVTSITTPPSTLSIVVPRAKIATSPIQEKTSSCRSSPSSCRSWFSIAAPPSAPATWP